MSTPDELRIGSTDREAAQNALQRHLMCRLIPSPAGRNIETHPIDSDIRQTRCALAAVSELLAQR